MLCSFYKQLILLLVLTKIVSKLIKTFYIRLGLVPNSGPKFWAGQIDK